MRKDKEVALKLRLGGKSYTEISQTLDVPKSTLSAWLSKVVLSPRANERIAARTREKSLISILRHNRQQTTAARKRASDTRKLAASFIGRLSDRDLLILGAALYWAEGYKRLKWRKGKELTAHPVSLTNSDPFLVQAFLKFLRGNMGVHNEKIKAGVRIFQHHNEQELLDFWQRITDIPRKNFTKTYVGISQSSKGKRPFNRLPYGTLQINVSSTPLFHQIMGYIEGLKENR
ncbi:MAG: hypothetical protein HYY10_02660 [Candidatus Liptonbacteria bacterium]|nr:hypothetical protein [Candidatus Liptonbacteria bacterium]